MCYPSSVVHSVSRHVAVGLFLFFCLCSVPRATAFILFWVGWMFSRRGLDKGGVGGISGATRI